MTDKKNLIKDKLVVFKDNEKIHADLKLKLDYEGMTQSQFFRHMIRLLLKEEERMMSIVKDWRESSGKSKRTTKQVLGEMEKEEEKKKETKEDFGLDDFDVEALYDMFEDEEDYE